MSVLQEAYEAQAKALCDFGYSGTTAAMVEGAHTKWIADQPAVGIIEMMCFGAFRDYPQIFGEQGQ